VKNPQAKALVAVLTGTGAVVGLIAAVVWHVATPTSFVPDSDFGWYAYTPARPSWFPTSLYLVGTALLISLILASFLVDAGLRVRVDSHRSRTGLFALLSVVGTLLGAGAAAAWTQWPPDTGEPPAVALPTIPPAPPVGSGTRLDTITIVLAEPDEQPSGLNAISFADYEDLDAPFAPVIDDPWMVFPIGGASIGGLLALSLSLRDLRLTGRG
jgi:hypothetical protein